MSKIVGAEPSEVAVMQTLTANLHFLLASFYRPTKERYKIIIEGKAFPSDHYAVHSAIHHHNLHPSKALVIIEPSDPEKHYYSTAQVMRTIKAHASSTALLLLPGIHFYSGQYFDIPVITSFAHSLGITVGWDLAHAAGNVPLKLHDWSIDFAVWCTYKYLNAGPGAIAGMFVHSKHSRVSPPLEEGSKEWREAEKRGDMDAQLGYRRRLSGWWGSDKGSRFRMENRFVPIPGAAGWQVSNPSVLDTTSVIASLEVFNQVGMERLRERSVRLTEYLEWLLLNWDMHDLGERPYILLTPSNREERGAQISVKLEEGLLEDVMESLEEDGVVVDERRPDVVRVAPAPLYNSFEDCWRFMYFFHKALVKAKGKKGSEKGGMMVEGLEGPKGWNEIT
jgi:kynureninase